MLKDFQPCNPYVITVLTPCSGCGESLLHLDYLVVGHARLEDGTSYLGPVYLDQEMDALDLVQNLMEKDPMMGTTIHRIKPFSDGITHPDQSRCSSCAIKKQ